MTFQAGSPVQTRFFDGTLTVPLVVEPARPGTALPEWVLDNQELIESSLHRHGAVRFRNFHAPTTENFEKVARAICPTLFPEYGDLPREGESELIYKSTPYPEDRSILFHNESSHLASWPMRQFFSCIVAPAAGGETPIVDCRRVYQQMRPALAEEFARRKVRYVRNFIESLDVSWKRFFGTDSPAEVERKCAEEGTSCEWAADGTLRTWRVADAVLPHPRTGEMVFFNQVSLHHPSCLESDTREALLEMFGDEGMPRNVLWGDGEPIPDEVVTEVRELLDQEAVEFTWQEGDVLVLDNMLIAHSRNPYQGPRKIVVALGDMWTAVSGADLIPAAGSK